MPVLDAQVSCYPPSLFDGCDHETAERQWWALHTKARQEKAVARDLLAQEVPFYLPLIPKTLIYERRKVVSRHPLFTGYVFMYGSRFERMDCLRTNRVSSVIPVTDQARLYDDLLRVHRLIECGAPLSVESRLAPGQAVRVRRGALEGMEGTIVSRHRRCRLIVAVEFLQQGVSLEVDDFLVEPI